MRSILATLLFIKGRRARQEMALLSTITLAARFSCSNGYGSMGEYLALGMARAGAMVNVVPLYLDIEGLSTEFQDILHRSRPDFTAPTVYFHWIRPDLARFRTSSDLFIYTMWEANRLPIGWAEQINSTRAVIVPTRFVAQVCRESGVTVPIEVVPQGIDPDIYHYEERPERDGLTTLMISPVDNRKHTLEGIAAWKKVFANDLEARLIIKTNYGYHNYTPDDPRILYVDTKESTRGIAHWYRQADVLLALGNEGFGLPLVEGMATGLPVIALNSEGQADVCEDASGYLLSVEPATWEAYDHALFGSGGIRGVPAVEDIVQQLSWVANHRDEARTIGRAASYWTQIHRNVWAKGLGVLEVMERYMQSARPLRKVSAL